MNNNLFKKTCGLVKYDTYNNIKTYLALFNLIFSLSGAVIRTIWGINIYSEVMTDSSLLGILGYWVMQWSKGEKYTKDITEIKDLYQIFLDKYSELSKIFDIKNPVELYAMFNYLLQNGYLSQGKKYEYFIDHARDIKYIFGAEVMTGKAVCRHNAMMLNDIFCNEGFVANYLKVYSGPLKIEYLLSETPQYKKEDVFNILNNISAESDLEKECIKEILLSLFENMKKFNMDSHFDFCFEYPNKKVKNDANHAITYVNYEGKNYFFDPTNSTSYQLRAYDNLYSDKTILLLPTYSRKKVVEQDNASLEEVNGILLETEKMCVNNLDILEKFYRENSELYTDISSKIEKIKKRKK